MIGQSSFQPCSVKPGRRALGGSPRGSRVAFRCCATARAPTDRQAHSQHTSLDRRQALSALLAAGVLLLPKPSRANGVEPLPEAISPAAASSVADDTAGVQLIPLEESAPAPGAAETAPAAAPAPQASISNEAVGSSPTQVYLDVTINGEPAGRLVVELFADAPAGASRFSQLAAGRQGVDYRLSKFNGVLPTYIRNDGLNRLSYSANEMSPISSGDSLEALEAELDRQTRRHDQTGLVSLVVREREARPVKERLVARDGKLITVLEQAGEAPNGTQFTITTAASPELDATNLIIGRVVAGEPLLRRIAALPVNKPRNDNPYFQAGKAIGDKRAVTAERAFYRPFQKVVVSGSGTLS